jgi:hypothetical protein
MTKETKTKQKKVNKTKVEQKKVSNFDNVDKGICPHCQEKTLEDEVAGKGEGVTRTCKKCQHTFYLNRKIRTCACRTCVTDKQKAKKKA